jgi:hypothetical protein
MAALVALTAGVVVSYASLGVVLHQSLGDDRVLRLPSKLAEQIPQISYGPAPSKTAGAADAARTRAAGMRSGGPFAGEAVSPQRRHAALSGQALTRAAAAGVASSAPLRAAAAQQYPSSP